MTHLLTFRVTTPHGSHEEELAWHAPTSARAIRAARREVLKRNKRWGSVAVECINCGGTK